MTPAELDRFVRLCHSPGTFEAIEAELGLGRRESSNVKA